MIRELIVVEGQNDISAVRHAVDAPLVATGGFALGPDATSQIRRAMAHHGIIVLTDPDPAGEQIRRRVAAIAGGPCKHAWVPREDCTSGDDVGIEHASPDAIRAALDRARCTVGSPRKAFGPPDLMRHGLSGATGARGLRRRVGTALGVGYGNARQLLRRLNDLGVTVAELEAAVAHSLSEPG